MPTRDQAGRAIPTLEEYLFQIDQSAQAAGLQPLGPDEIRSYGERYKQMVSQNAPFTHQPKPLTERSTFTGERDLSAFAGGGFVNDRSGAATDAFRQRGFRGF